MFLPFCQSDIDHGKKALHLALRPLCPQLVFYTNWHTFTQQQQQKKKMNLSNEKRRETNSKSIKIVTDDPSVNQPNNKRKQIFQFIIFCFFGNNIEEME